MNRHIYESYNFQLVVSLTAMSLGLRLCASRKGGTGGSRWISTLSPGNMAASGLSCRSALGGPFISYLAQMGLENGPLAM